MTLFEKCLKALKNDLVILSEEETKKVFDKMIHTFPITLWGRINWKNVKNFKKIVSINNIDQFINPGKKEVYILWDEASLPAIKTDMKKLLNVIDDITAVSFDTWIYCPKDGWVIEFYHEGEITIGFV
ncbi:hypothetical protein GF322_02830 [Candidatus Dependentiae bacterium]|nr:hypothetical protein [Candidatus Dependentiae bacterium]